jgi:hypothetical protein
MRRVILVLASLLVASSAYAQLGSLLSGGSKSAVSPEQIVEKYDKASMQLLDSQVILLDAVGLKEEAERTIAEKDNLKKGALSSDDVEARNALTTKNNEEINKKLEDKNTRMDAKSKEKFGKGLLSFSKAALSYVDVAKDAKSYKPGISSLGSAAKSALTISKAMPGDISSLKEVSTSLISFAKSNKIKYSKDAEVTGQLSGF